MDIRSLVGLGFLAAINLVAFFMMFWDKIRSRNKNNQRISEGVLFFMAICLGALGLYFGMLVFRHKTQKWYFIWGIPLLMVQNISLVYNLLFLIE